MRHRLRSSIKGAAMNDGKNPEECVESVAARPRWERLFFNSYGGYYGYRFQDFRSGCKSRSGNGDCTNPKSELAGDAETPCLCDYCPLVEADINEGDDTNYSEGEQPILVLELPQES